MSADECSKCLHGIEDNLGHVQPCEKAAKLGPDDDCPDFDDDEDHEYCSVCEDWIYTSGPLCGHIWWDCENGWWAGPGTHDGGKSCKESFLKLIQRERQLGPYIAIALNNGGLLFETCDTILHVTFSAYINGRAFSGALEDCPLEFQNGIRWLHVLANYSTPEVIEMTKQWLLASGIGAGQ